MDIRCFDAPDLCAFKPPRNAMGASKLPPPPPPLVGRCPLGCPKPMPRASGLLRVAPDTEQWNKGSPGAPGAQPPGGKGRGCVGGGGGEDRQDREMNGTHNWRNRCEGGGGDDSCSAWQSAAGGAYWPLTHACPVHQCCRNSNPHPTHTLALPR